MGAACVVAPGRNEAVLQDLARRFGPRLRAFKLTGDAAVDRELMAVFDELPAALREFAGLVGDVLVLGAIDRVELWNREAWDQKVLPEEERLTQGDDG